MLSYELKANSTPLPRPFTCFKDGHHPVYRLAGPCDPRRRESIRITTGELTCIAHRRRRDCHEHPPPYSHLVLAHVQASGPCGHLRTGPRALQPKVPCPQDIHYCVSSSSLDAARQLTHSDAMLADCPEVELVMIMNAKWVACLVAGWRNADRAANTTPSTLCSA